MGQGKYEVATPRQHTPPDPGHPHPSRCRPCGTVRLQCGLDGTKDFGHRLQGAVDNKRVCFHPPVYHAWRPLGTQLKLLGTLLKLLGALLKLLGTLLKLLGTLLKLLGTQLKLLCTLLKLSPWAKPPFMSPSFLRLLSAPDRPGAGLTAWAFVIWRGAGLAQLRGPGRHL